MRFRVLLLTDREVPPDPDPWVVGVCLEKDIVVQARSVEDAHYEMESALATNAALDEEHGIAPLSWIPASPEKFSRLFASARPLPNLGYLEFRELGGGEPIRSVQGGRDYRVLRVTTGTLRELETDYGKGCDPTFLPSLA